MARYRQKDEFDLRWNRIRRRITRELDTQIQDAREEMLNKLLTEAFEKHVEALESGKKLELEAGYPEFVKKAFSDALNMEIGEGSAALP